jgi:hypothetical protein
MAFLMNMEASGLAKKGENDPNVFNNPKSGDFTIGPFIGPSKRALL